MSEKISFKPDSALGGTIRRWWDWLNENKGARAELRRAPNLTAVALTSAFQRLYQWQLASGFPEPKKPEISVQTERLAAIAGLLAHVKEAVDESLPLLMSEGDRPPVSELRFRRLLDSPSIDDLFVGLRRALPLIDHKADLYDLAESVFNWGDNVKKKWAYNYRWPAKVQD